MLNVAVLSMALAAAPASSEALKAKVASIFADSCTTCHDRSDDLNLEDLDAQINAPASASGKVLVVPGKPAESYLLTKMTGQGAFEGELMPLEMGQLPPDQLQAVADWITSLAPPAGAAPTGGAAAGGAAGAGTTPPGAATTTGPTAAVTRTSVRTTRKRYKPFHGTHQIALPTTTTLGKGVLQWRLDHRFGRIGTPRGFFGLDAGVVMSMGLAVGVLDGWDIRLRRTNSLKGWELGTKYVPLRQEVGRRLSLGFEVSMDYYRAEDAKNVVSVNAIAMLSRLWFQRWSTMLTLSYSSPTNHAANPMVDFDMGNGEELVEDKRGTLDLGFATTVWLGDHYQWGLEFEYLQPIPIPGPDGVNLFYYRGGDAFPGPEFFPIGAWSIGGSYFTGKHYFQVFFTNNRQIHLNQAAPGGQTTNPFGADAEPTPLNTADFYLGFNLTRLFTLGKNAAKWRKNRQERQSGRSTAFRPHRAPSTASAPTPALGEEG